MANTPEYPIFWKKSKAKISTMLRDSKLLMEKYPKLFTSRAHVQLGELGRSGAIAGDFPLEIPITEYDEITQNGDIYTIGLFFSSFLMMLANQFGKYYDQVLDDENQDFKHSRMATALDFQRMFLKLHSEIEKDYKNWYVLLTMIVEEEKYSVIHAKLLDKKPKQ